MIKGLKEAINHWKDDAWFFIVEKGFRNVVFTGYLDDLKRLDLPGYRVSEVSYIGEGVLRITVTEEIL